MEDKQYRQKGRATGRWDALNVEIQDKIQDIMGAVVVKTRLAVGLKHSFGKR